MFPTFAQRDGVSDHALEVDLKSDTDELPKSSGPQGERSLPMSQRSIQQWLLELVESFRHVATANKQGQTPFVEALKQQAAEFRELHRLSARHETE